jgi:ABC-type glycerol-3-phosphate transport system substrate-binding protein
MSWPMLSAIWSEGGELTSRDLKKISLDDPVAVDVLSKFQTLLKEGTAVLPDKASGGHRVAFENNKAAMILDSPSPFSEIYAKSVGFTPGVANYPAGKKGRIYAPGAGGLVMISTTPIEKRQAAWSFIKFMLSAQNLADYSRKTGYVAFYPSAQKQMVDLLKDERYATIYAALPDVRWDFTLYWAPPVRDAFEQAWQKIFFDQVDVQTTLKFANQKAVTK